MSPEHRVGGIRAGVWGLRSSEKEDLKGVPVSLHLKPALGKVLRLFWIKFYILTIFQPNKVLACFQVVNNSQFEIAG